MTTETILVDTLDDIIAVCTKAKAKLAPAGPRVITDRLSRPKPPLPTLGPAGFSFPDPVFYSRILRVTDEHTGGGSTSWRTSSGSDRVWSADGAHFFVENSGGSGKVYAFDREAFAATERLSFGLWGPTWHQTDPHLIYGRGAGEAPRVEVLDITQPVAQPIIFDVLSSIAPIRSRERTYLRGIAHAAGALGLICGGTGQDSDDYAVYLPAVGAPKILDLRNDPRTRTFAHFGTLDLSGRYYVIGCTEGDMNAGRPTGYVWDTLLDTITPMRQSAGGHGAIGWGCSVNAPDDIDSQEYRFRSYADPDVATLIMPAPMAGQPVQWFASSHLSWNHATPDNQAPFVVASYRYGAGYDVTPATPWRPWDDEIISVGFDGVVKRHCHHRSDVRHDRLPLSEISYWPTPRPHTSPDGRYAVFTSNMERQLGADPLGAGDGAAYRQDVWLVELQV